MSVKIGSARISEKNTINGVRGDQTGREVTTEAFYLHNLGWNVLRPTSTIAEAMAKGMEIACENSNVGYSQNDRESIHSLGGVNAQKPCNCDCSSLVRACFIYATGWDCGNFNTASELNVLMRTGMFTNLGAYNSNTVLNRGDVLVTRSKGHTAIVVEGNTVRTKGNIFYQINHSGVERSNGQVVGTDNVPIKSLAIRVDSGTVKYRVHLLNKGWLDWVTGYNWSDYYNGYAGDDKTPIDAVQIQTFGDNGDIHYAVSRFGRWDFYSTVTEPKDMNEDYAGLYTKKIDKFKATLE